MFGWYTCYFSAVLPFVKANKNLYEINIARKSRVLYFDYTLCIILDLIFSDSHPWLGFFFNMQVCKCMFCTHRVHIQNNSMQAKGLQHAPDSKLWQCCPSCGAVGIVTIWAPDDHSKAWGDRNILNQSVNLALNNLKIYLQ